MTPLRVGYDKPRNVDVGGLRRLAFGPAPTARTCAPERFKEKTDGDDR